MKPNTIHGDDAITISEALKRLSDKNITPARQSFHDAVNRGSIQKISGATEEADGKIKVSWASVLAYVDRGGFKPRTKKGSTQPAGDHDQAPPQACTAEPSGAADALTGDEPTAASPPLPAKKPDTPNPHVSGANHPTTNALDTRRPKRRKKLPRQPRPTDSIKSKKIREAVDPKNRKPIPLRVLKNPLRKLSFEETKLMRDWLDNRLMTILRPIPAALRQEEGSERPTPTQTQPKPITA